VFLRGFTQDITLIAPHDRHDLSDEDQAKLKQYGINCINGPCEAVAAQEDCIIVDTPEGHHAFESVYPALGSDIHNQLALQVGAKLKDDNLIVDSHQRTTVPGLYAAGDVVLGLDQISHAMGEGGVAATTIRNDLAKERPIIREALSGSIAAKNTR
jgi:thioredoxin reductase (NADPH)